MSPPAMDAGDKKREGALATLGRWLRGAFLHNAALKFVALVLAVTLFILVNTGKDAVIGVSVGVSYTMPENRVLVSERVDQVRVTIRGSWRRVKRFDERELDRLHVDLRGIHGTEYSFPQDAIRLPPGLNLLSVEPASMALRFEPAVSKTVRVNVPTSGQPQRGYKVERIVARPSQITVRGAESAIETLGSVSTRQLDLSGRQASFVETLSLVPPDSSPVIQLMDTRSVDVEVALSEEMTTRRIEGVGIEVRPGPGFSGPIEGRFAMEPAQVDVILHGAQLMVESFGEDIAAYVEVYTDDTAGRAARQAIVHIASPPAGVGIEVVPHSVTLRPKRPE